MVTAGRLTTLPDGVSHQASVDRVEPSLPRFAAQRQY